MLHENRQALEQVSLQYFETHYPEIKYRGIIGFEPIDPNDPNSTSVLQYRSIQDFYHPINLVEPIDAMNAVILDLDVVTDPHQNKALKLALNTFEPTATEHYHRLTPGGNLTEESFIQLFHPGIPLPETLGKKPQDVSAIVVRIKNIVETATRQLPEALSFFLYDTTDNPSEGEFILGAQVYTIPLEETGERIVYLDEISYSELLEETVVYIHVTNIKVASRTWTMVAVALEDTFVPDIRYIILAGKFILVASLCVSLWIMTNYRRTKTVLEVKRKADMEKTAVIVRSARENAKAEQELNDYIAHEIRNPRKLPSSSSE